MFIWRLFNALSGKSKMSLLLSLMKKAMLVNQLILFILNLKKSVW
jgi:hypothetical protein